MSDDKTHFADDATLRRLHALEAENKRLREALEVYADNENWTSGDKRVFAVIDKAKRVYLRGTLAWLVLGGKDVHKILQGEE